MIILLRLNLTMVSMLVHEARLMCAYDFQDLLLLNPLNLELFSTMAFANLFYNIYQISQQLEINKIMTSRKNILQITKPYIQEIQDKNIDNSPTKSNQSYRNIQNPEAIEASKFFNQIISSKKYNSLYKNFLKSNSQLSKINQTQVQQQQQYQIRSFLTDSLQIKRKKSEFQQKYCPKKQTKNDFTQLINKKNINILTDRLGKTALDLMKNKKKMFFRENRKVLKLQQECLLLQYYYKDKQASVRTLDINYLNNRKSDDYKQQRFQTNNQNREKLYLSHNSFLFQKRQLINFTKMHKFNDQAFKKAQQNYSYKRKVNLEQMQTIIKDNHLILLKESSKKTSQQEQIKFNLYMKLFLNFAYRQDAKRIYFQFIDEEGLQKFIRFICDAQLINNIKSSQLNIIFQKILQNKVDRKVQFYDFIEFFQRVKESYKIDLLSSIGQKHPLMFLKHQQVFMNQNYQQINKEMTSKMIKYSLKHVFSSYSSLIQDKYLPVKAVPRLLSNYGISGNQIKRGKMFYFLYWNSRRHQGLTFQEFYQTCIMLGIQKNNWSNAVKLFGKIKIHNS